MSHQGIVRCLIPCVDQQWPAVQRMYLIFGSDNDDIVFADMPDDFGTDLLITPSQEKSLSADGGQDQFCLFSP